MSVFAFDWHEHADHYRDNGWVHIKSGVSPEFSRRPGVSSEPTPHASTVAGSAVRSASNCSSFPATSTISEICSTSSLGCAI